MSMPIRSLGAALALVVALPAAAQSADGGALYRCPGNDYSNTISASEAEKLRCKRVENASLTVIQSPPAAASGASAPPPARAVAEVMTPADATALRARASNARRGLEGRLRTAESQLAALELEFNGGEPARRDDEFDMQKYLDRAAGLRSAITRKQIEIAEIRRDIAKMPSR